MIDLPLAYLAKLGFAEVQLITGTEHAGQVSEHVGDGERYGFQRIDYRIQPKPLGIADCLRRIEHLVAEEPRGVLVMLADNYFEHVQGLDLVWEDPDYAHCWEFDVGDPAKAMAFGQVVRAPDGKVVDLIEKPKAPIHSNIVVGFYYFPSDVNMSLRQLKPSQRNELEITDLLRIYARQKRLKVHKVHGDWADLGEWKSWQTFVTKTVIM